jgi:hypothetical protein
LGARFTRVQEDFTCLHCQAEVHGTGYTNHCPRCLWSRHVDVYPGDRAATCHALMEPVAALSEGDETIVVQRCTGCGHLWRNKVSPADDRDAVFALFGRAAPHPETPPPNQPPRQPPKNRPSDRPGRGRSGNSSHRRRDA